jgi:hypothetical protein
VTILLLYHIIPRFNTCILVLDQGFHRIPQSPVSESIILDDLALELVRAEPPWIVLLDLELNPLPASWLGDSVQPHGGE